MLQFTKHAIALFYRVPVELCWRLIYTKSENGILHSIHSRLGNEVGNNQIGFYSQHRSFHFIRMMTNKKKLEKHSRLKLVCLIHN